MVKRQTWTASTIGKAVGRTATQILRRARDEGWAHTLHDPGTGVRPTKLFAWEALPADLQHALERGAPLSAIAPAARRTLRAQSVQPAPTHDAPAKAARKPECRRQRLSGIDPDRLARAKTATDEVRVILAAAVDGRSHAERDLAWLAGRYGLAGRVETLDAMAQADGVSKQWVRWVEQRVQACARVVVDPSLPRHLDAVYADALAARGLPWDGVEAQLRPVLGPMPLEAALRFAQMLQPREAICREPVGVHGRTRIGVVAVTKADARLIAQVSTAARKLTQFAGAGLVHDVRARVEAQRKELIAAATVTAVLEALPGLAWIEPGRWFWFNDETTPTVRRVQDMLTVAKAAVPFDVLYAGLARYARRVRQSIAAQVCDPVPSPAVLCALLQQHPGFRRSSGNAFSYGGPADLPVMETVVSALLAALEALGGIASRAELIAHSPVLNRGNLALHLYISPFVESVPPGLWAIRGRPIPESARQAALARRGDAASHAVVPVPDSDAFEVRYRVTAGARKGDVHLPKAVFGAALAGGYRAPSGHELQVRVHRQTVRLRFLPSGLRALLADPAVTEVVFRFDPVARTVRWAAAGERVHAARANA